MVGIDEMPTERQVGVAGALEAYYGVNGVFSAGGSWSFGESYFTDANGDGLVDFAHQGQVWFNHLDCPDGEASGEDSGAGCVPTFSLDSAGTRVPVRVAPVDGADPAAAGVNAWVGRRSSASCGTRCRRSTRSAGGSRRTPARSGSTRPRPCSPTTGRGPGPVEVADCAAGWGTAALVRVQVEDQRGRRVRAARPGDSAHA